MPAGVLADRFPRHRLLWVTGTGQAVAAATLGTLTLAGLASVPAILILTLTAGAIRGVEQAARQSYTYDVAGPAELMPGLALLGVSMRVGWLAARSPSAQSSRVSDRDGLPRRRRRLPRGRVPSFARQRRPPSHAATGSVWRGIVDFVAMIRRNRTLLVLMISPAAPRCSASRTRRSCPASRATFSRVGPEGLGAMNAARSLGGILGLAAPP